jgi:hypothetical protein
MAEQSETQQTGDASKVNQLSPTTAAGQVLPRVTIQFCTQCKWMLRAAYVSHHSPSRGKQNISILNDVKEIPLQY